MLENIGNFVITALNKLVQKVNNIVNNLPNTLTNMLQSLEKFNTYMLKEVIPFLVGTIRAMLDMEPEAIQRRKNRSRTSSQNKDKSSSRLSVPRSRNRELTLEDLYLRSCLPEGYTATYNEIERSYHIKGKVFSVGLKRPFDMEDIEKAIENIRYFEQTFNEARVQRPKLTPKEFTEAFEQWQKNKR